MTAENTLKYPRHTYTVGALILIVMILSMTSCASPHKNDGSYASTSASTSPNSKNASNDVSDSTNSPTPEESEIPQPEKEAIVMNRKPVASFIQLWAVKGWSEDRWDQEFAAMKEAGFTFIILQDVVDLHYATDGGWQDVNGEDYSKYTLSSVDSLYPSDIAMLKNADGGVDTLGNCLKSAKKNGMKVMMAPLGDNRWWLYGWNMPKADSGVTDLVNDSYFGKWVKQDSELSNQIASEIYQKYGKDYGDVIYGWYYLNELWNMPLACEGTDNGVLTKILANSFNIVLDHYSSLTPGKPLLFSPFCNFTLSSPSGYAKMWKDLFQLVNFRKGDIFCPQDSIGGNPDRLPVLAEWTKAYKDAADTKPGLVLWSNNEDFTGTGGTALLDRYIQQINITSQYAEQNIVFSWNHYINPPLANANAGYHTTYLDCIKNGKLESTPPSDPTLSYSPAGNGYQIDIGAPKDNIGIAGYNIYDKTGKAVITTLFATKDEIPGSYSVAAKGTYYVEAFDFAGNVSRKVKIAIS